MIFGIAHSVCGISLRVSRRILVRVLGKSDMARERMPKREEIDIEINEIGSHFFNSEEIIFNC